MVKYDVFTEYKIDQDRVLKETENSLKSFVKVKFGYVIDKNRELDQHKRFIGSRSKIYSIGDIQTIKQISGIYTDTENLQSYISQLPKYSFAIWFRFELKAPYFSKDDDEFYIIQNPVLKETNFTVPMVRGSGWKGALANAFRELFKEGEDNREKIESFLRIFGAGSDAIKTIEGYVIEKVKKSAKEMQDKLLEFLLFELGLKIDKELMEQIRNINTMEDFKNFLKEKLHQKQLKDKEKLPQEFQTHKGRAIFYPTYFDKLSLEIINPHDRRKRAGTKPIHYEVVPEGTAGIFQLIYIPFDGIVKSDKQLEYEAKEDFKNLCDALEKLQKSGIGAKTKLGWGRFEIKERKVCINSNSEIPGEWERCQD